MNTTRPAIFRCSFLTLCLLLCIIPAAGQQERRRELRQDLRRNRGIGERVCRRDALQIADGGQEVDHEQDQRSHRGGAEQGVTDDRHVKEADMDGGS